MKLLKDIKDEPIERHEWDVLRHLRAIDKKDEPKKTRKQLIKELLDEAEDAPF